MIDIFSTYPCLWCIMPKSDFNTDFELQGGPLRDVGHIIDNAELYQQAVSDHTGSTKLSSAPWFNCEYPPLDPNLPRDCKILRYTL